MGQTAKSCREISFFGPVQNVLVVSKQNWTVPKIFWTYRRIRYWSRDHLIALTCIQVVTCHLLNGYELQACLDFVKSAKKKKKIDKLEKAKKHGSNDRNTDG